MRLVICIVFVVFSTVIFAQKTKVVSDFRMKTRFTLVYDLQKKIEFAFAAQAYFEKNAAELDEYFIELEAKYKPFSLFHANVGYRHTWNYSQKEQLWNGLHRINIDAIVPYKINRFKLSYRLRYQNIDDDIFLYQNNSNIANHIIRNRLRIKYNIANCKLTPFGSFEHYWNTNPSAVNDKVKFNIGAKYSTKKYGGISSYYQIMHELASDLPYTFYILFVGYTYKL